MSKEVNVEVDIGVIRWIICALIIQAGLESIADAIHEQTKSIIRQEEQHVLDTTATKYRNY